MPGKRFITSVFNKTIVYFIYDKKEKKEKSEAREKIKDTGNVGTKRSLDVAVPEKGHDVTEKTRFESRWPVPM